MSPILVTLTSHCDSDFERSSIGFNENRLDGVDQNSNVLDYCVRKNGGKILRFSEDCIIIAHFRPELCCWLVQKIRSLFPHRPATIYNFMVKSN